MSIYVATILYVTSLVSYWIMGFYYGRNMVGGNYFRKGSSFFLIGLACWFGGLATGAVDFESPTLQEWGIIGLAVMAFFGSSLGGGYLFEKRKKRRK